MSESLRVYQLPRADIFATISKVMQIREAADGLRGLRNRNCWYHADQRINFLSRLLDEAIQQEFGIRPFDGEESEPAVDLSGVSTLDFRAPFCMRRLLREDEPAEFKRVRGEHLMRGLYLGVGEYPVTDRAATAFGLEGDSGIFVETILLEDANLPKPMLTLLPYQQTMARVG